MSRFSFYVRRMAGPVLSACAIAVFSSPLWAVESPQKSYASPDAASLALFESASSGDAKSIDAVFGPKAGGLGSGDPVQAKSERASFVKAYKEKHSLRLEGDDRATLVLGNDEWPFPVPLVKVANAWHFDTAAGREELLNRRVGRNELHAEQVLLAIVDAQQEYAAEDRDGDGVREYAQKFSSSTGRFDGLYWPAEADGTASPLGPLVATAVREGHKFHSSKRRPYWGYYYRILSAQGRDARGGAYDYLARGDMIGGFAIIAYPAEYGASGIKTFIVNHDGVVYEKDLGADTTRLAQKIKLFNPGGGWMESAKSKVAP